jgi:thiamine biosynthesis lipoprotein ApbE
MGNTHVHNLNRRSFLKLPALLPLRAFDSAFRLEEYHYGYEGILGTSMDLVVWTRQPRVAECACETVLGEIDRLSAILSTRDARSEISLLESSNLHCDPSRELQEVLDAYDYWKRRTGGVFSIRPGGANTPRNVDALGKAYILDRAAAAVRNKWSSIDALLLNIGGDIVVWGRSCSIEIANPAASYDNAPTFATIDLQDAAIATSGTYARGAHLMDARNGRSLKTEVSATVVGNNAVTANALATTLCLTDADYGLQLVEATAGAEALRVASGGVQRTSGLRFRETSFQAQTLAPASWPAGYQLTITLPLTSGRSKKRPYVAVWVEDSSGKLVRLLAFWGGKKYYSSLSSFFALMRNQGQLRSVTRATRPAGKYELMWDGLDEDHKPVPLGSYRITVETNQEHGTYARQSGTMTLGDSPLSITLPATTNFDAVSVQYGPK